MVSALKGEVTMMKNLVMSAFGVLVFLSAALAGCSPSTAGVEPADGSRAADAPPDGRTDACIAWRADGVCLSDPPPANDHDRDGFTSDVDCNDEDEGSFPGNSEVLCDGVDQNCDGVDLCFLDEDLDGSASNLDCDDHDPARFPAAVDASCDGVDQNCDGWDACDRDGDGYVLGGDCDDTRADVHPGAVEIACDSIDNDCWDGECCDQDADLDGFPCRLDCNDHNQLINPDATPPTNICPTTDWNCDGHVDGDSRYCL